MKRPAILALAFAMLSLSACDSEDPPTQPPPSEDVTVRMDDIAFIDPQGNRNEDAVVTIEVGETVRWENDDSVAHTVTSTDPEPNEPDGFDSGNLAPGEDFEVTFDTPGTYVYYCALHPTEMVNATVIVE